MRRFHACLLAFLPALACAQGVTSLSLADAEALWREHSRELRLAAAMVDAAAGDLKTAGQAPNPELSLNFLQISRNSGTTSGNWLDKKVDSQLRVDQLIERGGKRELRQRSAGARLEAAHLDLADTSRQQLAELRRAYFDLKLVQEKAGLAEETAALYARSVEAARKRLKAGDLAPVDVARLGIDQSRADSEARAAQAELVQARQALAYLIGRETAAAGLMASEPWPSADDAALAETLPAKRADLEAARRRSQAADAERDLARAKRARDITVGVQYEHFAQNAPVNSYGVGVSIPLFVWHEHEGEIARAEADALAASLQAQKIAAMAGGQWAQARAQLLAARERVRRLDGGLLADAERVAQAAELAYTKGAMGLIDLLDARRTLRQLRVEAVTARADYAKARADWQAQMDSGKTP